MHFDRCIRSIRMDPFWQVKNLVQGFGLSFWGCMRVSGLETRTTKNASRFFFFAFFPEYIIGNWSRVEWCGVQRSGCQGCIVRWSDCSLPALFITVWMDRWMAGRMGWMWMGGCRSGWAGSGCRIYLP